MPVEKESKLAQWVAAFREGWPGLKARLDNWTDAVREEPRLIWATPAIRYTVYVAAAIIILLVLSWVFSMVAPAGEVAPPAETADYRVQCSDPGCGHSFVINEEFGFDDFPVVCPKCGKESGERMLRCASKTCRRRWVVPRVENGQYVCPNCGGWLGEVD